MLRGNSELWFAFLTCLVITSGYGSVVYWTREIPASREFFGHTLGIVGFNLKLMTEIL